MAGLAGAVALAFLLPVFDAPLPRGLKITRAEAKRIADTEAARLGIETTAAFPTITWESAPILEGELAATPALRRWVAANPVVGPRLGGFRVTYFRPGLEKFPEFGYVVVGVDGSVLGARRRLRAEEKGASPTAESLRPEADRFVASRAFPGAPSPVFESVRPSVTAARTDHTFRYAVPYEGEPKSIRFLLTVQFSGERLSGWELWEEHRDGSAFRYQMGGNLAGFFLRIASSYALLFLLLAIFLKKYHAGEVGVGTGALLLGVVTLLFVVADTLVAPASAYGTNFGGTDALATTVAMAAFKLLFYDVPIALLVFVGWSVGESYARERWGAKLASFDALLRRDPWNATVGGSVLTGLLASPAVAAAALLPALFPVLLGVAHPALPEEAGGVLNALGGPVACVFFAALMAIPTAVVGLLFPLASQCKRPRRLAIALVQAGAIGALFGAGTPPVEPLGWQIGLGFGAALAAAGVFLASDLLAAAVALFAGGLLHGLLPLVRTLEGTALTGVVAALAVPFLVLLSVALGGLWNGRLVTYSYEDLAPHVRRIVERERVKAEIDAANRIQAALLPPRDPVYDGASIASHYGAATEIGGDYFDFLPLGGGRLGLAFGDVAGHGLTSGIVMAMAKSALLVQTEHDASPRRVLEVLNEHVLKTAPKRMLMTFFFGVLDLATGELRYSSAGHLDPYVYRAGTGLLEPLSAWGFPLGVKRRDPFGEHVALLEPGDRLVLYSDGLIEAVDDDGEPFGFERFEGVLSRSGARRADEVRREVLAAVARFTRNRPPEDDQTLVVLAYEGQGEAEAAA